MTLLGNLDCSLEKTPVWDLAPCFWDPPQAPPCCALCSRDKPHTVSPEHTYGTKDTLLQFRMTVEDWEFPDLFSHFFMPLSLCNGCIRLHVTTVSTAKLLAHSWELF